MAADTSPTRTAELATTSTPAASIDQFSEVLSQDHRWYTLGIFLGAPKEELDDIERNYQTFGIMRCLVELHKCLENRMKSVSWDSISTALRRMKNYKLANEVHTVYVLPQLGHQPAEAASTASSSDTSVTLKGDIVEGIAKEFLSLSERFSILMSKTKTAFRNSNVSVEEVQDVVEDQCGSLTHQSVAGGEQLIITFNVLFAKLKAHCSLLNFRVLNLLVVNFLRRDEVLQKQMRNFRRAVDNFKSSVRMGQLVGLIKEKQEATANIKIVKLKVRQFWADITIQQFENVVSKILGTLYDLFSQISVAEGCMCVSWIMPDKEISKLVPELPLVLLQVIGVIFLHIGEKVVYKVTGKGSENIEAAMLQAIELKNTQAIELLLAMGCNPEVATYTGDKAVTTIVNIKEMPSSSEHVCILGKNKHVDALLSVHQQDSEDSQYDAMKDAYIEELLKKLKHKEAEVEFWRSSSASVSFTGGGRTTPRTSEVKTASPETVKKLEVGVNVRQRLGINTTMIFTIETASRVRATLSWYKAKLECPVSSTGRVFVTPQELGVHQLSIFVKDQPIKNSPFVINVVPQPDYTRLKDPAQVITDINSPTYIAFSSTGDAYITSKDDHCVYVYDKQGRMKNTIGEKGPGRLQFNEPLGIDIFGDIVYVCECGGQRVQKLTTSGHFISTIKVSEKFDSPHGIKISPQGKMYISDRKEHLILAFDPTANIFRIEHSTKFIGRGLFRPMDIDFDLSGKIHVTGFLSSSVMILDTYLEYDRRHISCPAGIAIDPSGYSLVTSWDKGSLTVFDPNGAFVHLVEGFYHPYGVAVSPTDGSIWVADTGNNRLVRYTN